MAPTYNPFEADYVPESYKPRSSYGLIDSKIVQGTLGRYDENSLFRYFNRIVDAKKALEVFTYFRVGTIAEHFGAPVFWQTDTNQQVRTGWIESYDSQTGQGNSTPILAHNALGLQSFVYTPCFFGEHQIKNRPSATVAIVGDEVAAMICTVYFPDYVWLASRELLTFKPEQFRVLSGRNVVLLPPLSIDGSLFRSWTSLADTIRQQRGCLVSVSTYLEDNASDEERAAGLDIAHILVHACEPFNDVVPPVAEAHAGMIYGGVSTDTADQLLSLSAPAEQID